MWRVILPATAQPTYAMIIFIIMALLIIQLFKMGLEINKAKWVYLKSKLETDRAFFKSYKRLRSQK